MFDIPTTLGPIPGAATPNAAFDAGLRPFLQLWLGLTAPRS